MSDPKPSTSALIVDFKLEEINQQREILHSLSYSEIDVASSVNMALSYLREHRYDLLLVAYDLGKNQKNGLQVIQEAVAESLPLNRTVMVLMTASDVSVLVGSLDAAPDVYLAKPLTKDRLNHRLEKLSRIKRAVYRVEEAMDQSKWNQALAYSEKLRSMYPGLSSYLDRMVGICFLATGKYGDAEITFKAVASERKQNWALLGQGIALFNQGRYAESQTVLQVIIDHQVVSIEAYNCYSLGLHATGHPVAAITTMRKAIMLQPCVSQAHSLLGNLSAYTLDWPLAVSSFRDALNYSRYSAFQNSDHYFALVKSLIEQFKKGEITSEQLETESVRVLEAVSSDFESVSVAFRVHIMGFTVNWSQEKKPLALAHLSQSHEIFLTMSLEDQWLWLEWLEEAIELSAGDSGLTSPKADMIRNRKKDSWVDWMLVGLNHHKQSSLLEAEASLVSSLKAQPDSVLTLFTLGYVLIAQSEQKVRSVEQATFAGVLNAIIQLNFGQLSTRQVQHQQILIQRLYSFIAS